MWTGVYLSGRVKKILLMSHGFQYVGLLRALYTSCYCRVFLERQRDICCRCAYSQGYVKAMHMSNDRQNVYPA